MIIDKLKMFFGTLWKIILLLIYTPFGFAAVLVASAIYALRCIFGFLADGTKIPEEEYNKVIIQIVEMFL